MIRDLNTFADEMCNYTLKLTEIRSDLTEIQRSEYFKRTSKELNDKGIRFNFIDSPDGVGHSLEYIIPKTEVEGIGQLIDVREYGAYPLSIEIKKAHIIYEPRNMQMLSRSSFDELKNTEYINLKQGDDKYVSGKITSCKCNLDYGGFTLYLSVCGEAASEEINKVVKVVQRKAEKEGMKYGLIGVLIGGILGVALYVVVGIICYITGNDAGNGFYYMLLSALIVGVFMYYVNYSSEKERHR